MNSGPVLSPRTATYELENFVLNHPHGRTRYDGIIHVNGDFSFRHDGDVRIDLLVEQDAVTVRAALDLECEAELGCELSDGVELVGVGGAIVFGSIAPSVSETWFGLRGVERVEVSTDRAISVGRCLHWRLAGTDRIGFPFPCAR